MIQKHFWVGAIGAVTLCALSCAKPTPFGSELLQEDLAAYDFSDTLTLRFFLEKEDSVRTSDPSSTAQYFLCGQIKDSDFGVSQADVYTLYRPHLGNEAIGKDDVLDSAILYLNLNPTIFYGDTLQTYNLKVYALDEALGRSSSYFSNQSLPTGVMVGELLGFQPRISRRDSLLSPTARAAFLRIPLTQDFGKALFQADSATLAVDTNFYRVFKGLKITLESPEEPGAMLGINLNNDNFSFIRLFYKRDTVAKTARFVFLGANKFNGFTHDYSGATVEPLIGQPLIADRLYLQGMQGLRMRVEIPYVDLLEDMVVNQAELELTVAQDDPRFPPARQLILSRRESDDNPILVFTPDVAYSLSSGFEFDLFGGAPIETSGLKKYRLTLSQIFQRMIDDTSGQLKNKTLYVNVYPQSSSPGRVIFFGSGDNKPHIRLKATRLK